METLRFTDAEAHAYKNKRGCMENVDTCMLLGGCELFSMQFSILLAPSCSKDSSGDPQTKPLALMLLSPADSRKENCTGHNRLVKDLQHLVRHVEGLKLP